MLIPVWMLELEDVREKLVDSKYWSSSQVWRLASDLASLEKRSPVRQWIGELAQREAVNLGLQIRN